MTDKNVTNRVRVAILFGGPSNEHDVSCNSAVNVANSLDSRRYIVTPIRITLDGRWIVGDTLRYDSYFQGCGLEQLTPDTGDKNRCVGTSIATAIAALQEVDVVFPVLHGPYGEDGTVQAFLELMKIPYVGNGIFASAAGMDKQQTKRLLTAEGIKVAAGLTVDIDDSLEEQTRNKIIELGLPVFVKPARSGSSVGVSRVDRWSDLDAALKLAAVSDSKILVEREVAGREIDVAVLQFPNGKVVAGPPLEIILPDNTGFFDYQAKYKNSSTKFNIPAELNASTVSQLQDMAIDVFRILDCSCMLRVDFFLRETNTGPIPVVNEVNTMPGMTAMSQYPQVWQATGMSYPDLLSVLIDSALGLRRRAAW